MITKYIRHLTILLLFAMQSYVIAARSSETNPVTLSHYSGSPKLGANPKPSQSSDNFAAPLDIFIDDNDKTLSFDNSNENEITYYIYDDKNPVLQGSFIDAHYSLNLKFLPSGSYIIAVVCDGVTYKGTFELE